MSENKIEKRPIGKLKERGQYFLAFFVVGSMLLVAGFPVFVIFFFAIFAYFLFRIFTAGNRSETRDIFEFYLTANEILREDGRNWFGFEIRDAISRGESIVHRMPGAPPLVYFALGALYNKAGEHQSAINALTQVVEADRGNESSYVNPTPELRNYVKILRKIEREPSEAPLTSAAIRALERARRIRGSTILGESRAAFVKATGRNPEPAELPEAGSPDDFSGSIVGSQSPEPTVPLLGRLDGDPGDSRSVDERSHQKRKRGRAPNNGQRDPYADRKPITEVLHDIYDKNVQ
ncbi:MAG TPA: hypothetical protein PKD26_06035 [Pyrinomonadaceae bacterium]|nr:hypothetical protein [Pyrinomonadaceae bacterium]